MHVTYFRISTATICGEQRFLEHVGEDSFAFGNKINACRRSLTAE